MLTRAQCRFKRRQIHVASFVAGGSHLAAQSFDKVFATQATRIRRRGGGLRAVRWTSWDRCAWRNLERTVGRDETDLI